MRIAMISYFLPQPGQRRGGIERVAHTLAQGLAERGHQVTVWSYDPRPPEATYHTAQLPWAAFAGSHLGKRLLMGYAGQLLPLVCRLNRPQVLILHGDSLLASQLPVPVIRIVHGTAAEEALAATSNLRIGHQLGVWFTEWLTTVASDHCVAVSENTRTWYPLIRQVIPNGIDLQHFTPAPWKRSPAPSILFVGTMDGRKRGEHLLTWFEQAIRPEIPDAQLWLVAPRGRPSPGAVYFDGIPDTLLAELYQQAWIYASPSSYEGFGLPYVEAMASGTPVVATPNPGSIEVLAGGRSGILVSDAQFATTLANLLRHPEQRDAWSREGLARARHYDLARMIDAYESLCHRVATPEPLGSSARP